MQNAGGAQPESAVLNQALVEHLKKTGVLTVSEVEAAFRAVPRHLFLPALPLEEVYRDQAITTKMIEGKFVSSSSQPSIMAIMLEQLHVQEGQRILEIGAGTGYNAALLARLVGDKGQVVTIDIDEDIVEQARNNLVRAGFGRVRVLKADGALGYGELAPFDRIVLTVNAADIAPAWQEQLAENGRLLLPLSLRGPQFSVAFDRVEEHLSSVSLRSCGFVELRGSLAEKSLKVIVFPQDGKLSLRAETPGSLTGEAIWRLLQEPYHEIAMPIQASRRELLFGFVLWLSLRQPAFYELFAYDQSAEPELLPWLFHHTSRMRMSTAIGLLADDAICALSWDDAARTKLLMVNETTQLGLKVRWYGASQSIAEELRKELLAWDAEGRPTEERLHIDAYALSGEVEEQNEGEIEVRKRNTRFVCSW